MSVEKNKAARRRYIEALNEALEQADLSVFDEFFDPAWVGHVASLPESRGIESLKDGVRTQLQSFSDMRFTIHDMVGEGDKVATRWTLTGVHTGEFLGLPPTHRRFTLGGTRIDRFVDGKTVETWEELDIFGLMQQLSAQPGE